MMDPHGDVRRAIKNGSLIEQPCITCGKKAVAHHPDYARPLDVVWLCRKHHRLHHAMLDREHRVGIETCTLRLRSEYMNEVRKHAKNEERKLSEMTNLIIKIGLARYNKIAKALV